MKESFEELKEGKETLGAIRRREVDSIIDTPEGHKAYLLESAEKPYRLLVNAMAEGVVLLSEDRSILYCNQSFSNLVNEPIEKIFASNIEDFIAPDSLREFNELLSTCISKKTVVTYELALCTPRINQCKSIHVQLSLHSVVSDGSLLTFLTVTDLTNLKETQSGLKKNEQALRQVFENTVFGIAVIGLNGEISRINPAFSSITGYSEEEIISNNFGQFMYLRDLAIEQKCIRQVIRQERDRYELEKRIFCKNGDVKWAHTVGTAIHNINRQPIGVIATLEDITERKIVERQLAGYRSQLEKMVEKRTSQLKVAERAIVVNNTAGLVGQQLLLKYIFNKEILRS